MARRCDCESAACHPKADCSGTGTVKTTHSTICAQCATKMPNEYLIKTYQVSLHEVVNGEPSDLVERIEFEAPGLRSGQTVFHLLRQLERDILINSGAAAGERENGDRCPHGNQVHNAQGQLVPCGSAGYDNDENLIICGQCTVGVRP
jgi:hypothetical protein